MTQSPANSYYYSSSDIQLIHNQQHLNSMQLSRIHQRTTSMSQRQSASSPAAAIARASDL